MKNMILMAAGMTMLLGARTGEASSWTSGNACSTELATIPTSVSINPWGATNSSASPIGVNCPLADATGGVTKITMLAYDRSTATDVCCTISGFDTAGAFVPGPTLCTTGGFPGASLQIVSMAVPSSNARIWTAHCTLPAVVAGAGGYSHVVAIGLQ